MFSILIALIVLAIAVGAIYLLLKNMGEEGIEVAAPGSCKSGRCGVRCSPATNERDQVAEDASAEAGEVTRHSKRVRFYSTVDLVNLLQQEKAAGKAGKLTFALMRMDLVILDELGYLPFSQAGGALLFHLLSKLYEHTSVMIRTNLTFGE